MGNNSPKTGSQKSAGREKRFNRDVEEVEKV
jgi:hypothetical protein